METHDNGWYLEVSCDTWMEFVKEVINCEKKERETYPERGWVLYRGQSERCQKLESSFDRAFNASSGLKAGYERWHYEAAILREFMRRTHQYVTSVPNEKDFIEWLALMRHYGAPTRLLDFTYSHNIAAYFAFSSFKQASRAVWAISAGWLMQATERILSKDDLRKPENFVKHCFNTESPEDFVVPLNAERMNERLTIQQGTFLCPGNIGKSFNENLISLQPTAGSIVQFLIPHKERNKVLTELKHMNISNATLFPDLDGFAKSLNDRFELLFRDYYIPVERLREVVIA